MIEEKEYKFDKPGIHNTDELMKIVKSEIDRNSNISDIIISTTTGYTAKKAEEILGMNRKLMFCGQDISKEFSMDNSMKKYLKEKYKYFEIPRQYLKTKIGKEAVQILRSVSQGFKVCIEMLHFLENNGQMKNDEEYILIAGTLKGADTAILVKYNNLTNYYIKQILCRP